MISRATKQFSMFWLFSIVLLIIQTTTYHGLSVNASSSTSFKARPKIDLSDPFYDGQIQYDDTLTETPIGTIIYAIDDESSETDPLDSQRNKNFQLQDVVTHGNINDKSFMNHNLFTIGDGNDANTDIGSDEDDFDDGIDNDGVIDKQATQSKYSNFAFSSDKSNRRHSLADKHSTATTQSHHSIDSQPKPNTTEINDKNNNNENHELRHGQHLAADNPIAIHSPNGQMINKQSNKTMEARTKSHRHHNRKANKWSRRHQKWLKQQKSKSHHNRHSSLSRSGSKPQPLHPNQSSNKQQSPTFIQAHVNFYDSNGDDSLNSNRMSDMASYRSGNKWPHLSRLQSQLHQDILGDSLPPYIRKYHRRNKQLIGLLEGEGMPNVNGIDSKRKLLPNLGRRRKHHNNNHNNNNNHHKWIEKNLFEEQQQQPSFDRKNRTETLPSIDKMDPIALKFNSKQRYLIEKNLQREANALPGEHLSISEEDYKDCDDENDDCHGLSVNQPKIHKRRQPQQQQQQQQQQHHESNLNPSPKADSFLFHRVATPRLVGTGTVGGGLIKQKLPFVALTDKRIEDGTRQRHINTIQNSFPLS